MDTERVILSQERFTLTIERLCHQLIEQFDGFGNTCIIGIQPRGTALADRIYRRLTALSGNTHIPYGKLDITFHRDDFRMRDKPLVPSINDMDFLVEGMQVVLVDDVLYTGRTIQAALAALNDYGRPQSVELAVLVDRRFNRRLPIQADFIGITVDALDQAYVQVAWAEQPGEDRVLLFADKKDRDK
jgi:pyrimidine operon attenuation protein/uracil phosphoribosyltransferase